MRDATLRLAVAGGCALAAITGLLSPFDALGRGPLLIAWSCVAALGLWRLARRQPASSLPRPGWLHAALIASMAAVAGIAGFVAVVSAPDSTGAMAYHLPRVYYWAQAASVRFYATNYLPPVMPQPFAEYAVLHTWLLGGGDRCWPTSCSSSPSPAAAWRSPPSPANPAPASAASCPPRGANGRRRGGPGRVRGAVRRGGYGAAGRVDAASREPRWSLAIPPIASGSPPPGFMGLGEGRFDYTDRERGIVLPAPAAVSNQPLTLTGAAEPFSSEEARNRPSGGTPDTPAAWPPSRGSS